jgi:polar amino acid transport system substrate-binding protein
LLLPPLLLALLLVPPGARASGAVCSRPLQVGISPLGYAAFMQQGRPAGILPELIALLAQRSGCTLQLAFRPRARVLLEFGQGKLDLITSLQQTPERDQLGLYVPYSYAEIDLVVRADAGVDSLAALLARPGLSLGTVRGFTLDAPLQAVAQQFQSQGRLELAPDYENLASRLRAGRIPAALIPSTIHAKLLADDAFGAPVFSIDIEESEPLELGMYLSLSTLTEAERTLLVHQLHLLVQAGEVRRIYARHLGEGLTRRLFGKPPRAPR